jgi:methylated-DNA-[protein]-cysteine S-methyltransferase
MADIDTLLTSSETVPAAVLGRFVAAAEPDVAVAPVDAPFGRIWVGVTPRGLVRVAYGEYGAVLADLARRISPRVLEAPARADDVRRQLDEFFAGTRTSFDLALDWSGVRSEFQREVLRAAAAIPYGGRRTYTEVATAAGSPRAVRAAGSALGANPLCIVVPCHRVLPASGGVGGYAGGPAAKRWLLDRESA